MSLVFPTNPSNGDEYQGYVYDSTDNVWNRLPNNPEFVRFSETAPSNPQEGTLWFNTTVGKMFVYYNDGTSSQWVSAVGGIAGQSGTEGQMLIHDGTEWVAYDGGSRNLLYNGAMQVAQRGTSASNITDTVGYYTADRWYVSRSGTTGTWTQTLENDGPVGSGFTKSLKMNWDVANASLDSNDLLQIVQFLEGQDLQTVKKGTTNAESLTMQFWVKSNVIGTYILELRDWDNDRTISSSYSISQADTWEKKVITFAPDTTGAFDNDSDRSFQISWWLCAGSTFSSGTLAESWQVRDNADRAVGQINVSESVNNYFQITGVQLETGTVATPFEHKSYATELAECQRYYYQIVQGGTYNPVTTMTVNGTNGLTGFGALPVTMRANPTGILVSSGTVANDWYLEEAGSGKTVTGAALYGYTARWQLDMTANSLTAGRSARLFTGSASNTGLAWSAEL